MGELFYFVDIQVRPLVPGVAIFAAFKLKLYFFSKAVILVQYFMKFGVLGILFRSL